MRVQRTPALGALLLLVPAAASAHGGAADGTCLGGEAFAHEVRFPERLPEAIVVTTSFGLLVSRDGGGTFRWVCPEAYFIQTRDNYTTTTWPTVSVLPDGALFALMGPGYRESRDFGCSFDADADEHLANGSTSSVVASPLEAGVVLATSEWPGLGPFGLFLSADNGASFAPLSTSSTHSAGALVGPWPELYGVSTPLSGGDPEVLYSDDRGATFTPMSLAPGKVFLIGTTPGAPERLYLERLTAPTAPCTRTTTIELSIDRGRSFRVLRTRSDDILVDAVPTAAHELWIAWLNGGLERLADDGSSMPATAQPLGCVGAAPAGRLVICPRGVDDFVRWREADGTESTLVGRSNIVGPLDCPPGTAVHDTCAARWNGFVAALGLTPPAEEPPGGDSDRPPPRSHGCTCSATSPLPLAALLGLAGRRRRGRLGG